MSRPENATNRIPVKRLPNLAGKSDVDDIIAAELAEAGIEQQRLSEAFRLVHPEMRTVVIGVLHGWVFERQWRYWIAKGPGIEVAVAEKLHEEFGKEVRVAGHCGCPSPREWFKGLACGLYHVDTQRGLNALAATICSLVGVSRREELKQPQIEVAQ